MTNLARMGFVPATASKPASEPAKAAVGRSVGQVVGHNVGQAVGHSPEREAEAAAFATMAHATRGRLRRDKVKVSFRADAEAVARITAFAEAQGITLSDVLRDLAERFAARLPKEPGR